MVMWLSKLKFIGLCLATLVFTQIAADLHAATTGDPADQGVLLRLVGPSGEERQLTMADLDALPQHSFTTGTLWTSGPKLYSGPSLHDTLALVGMTDESSVIAVAANDYRVDFKPGAIESDVPIIATRIDGEPYGLRERGPLWIIYPFDSNIRFQTEVAYSQSIWQLVELHVSR